MIIDNKANGKIGEELRKNITKNARLSVISSLFSIYGYSELKTELEKTDSFRLLLPQTSYQGKNRIDNELEIRGLTGSEVDRRFRNTLNLTQIARECAEWLSRKAEIKAVAIPIPQNLFQVAKPDGENIAIYGSSPFSTAGLGFTPSNSFDMNTLTSGTEAKNLLKWFDSIWNSPEEASDIKKIVLKQLENIFSDKSPRLIYFLI
ncbi:MAG: helicase, partial [Methanosarcina sp.]|nr:helicase [Methanosarcina sp.]